MDNIAPEFAALPPEEKQQIVDFFEFIKNKYAAATKKAGNLERSEEPFIGMWRDRDDMRDSSSWIRKTRNSEWAIKDV